MQKIRDRASLVRLGGPSRTALPDSAVAERRPSTFSLFPLDADRQESVNALRIVEMSQGL